jgi:hypothetical protein
MVGADLTRLGSQGLTAALLISGSAAIWQLFALLAAGQIAGPAIAGALVASVGAGWALAAEAATFGLSAVILAQLRQPRSSRLATQPFLRDRHDGWREFRSRTWL